MIAGSRDQRCHCGPAHYLGAFPLALAAGQWGWGIAITGPAVNGLSVTARFALARRS